MHSGPEVGPGLINLSSGKARRSALVRFDARIELAIVYQTQWFGVARS